jgi:hypothetical protein
MTVSKNRKQASSETVGKEEQQTGSRRGKTRVSTILDVRGVGKKTAKASQKRKDSGGGKKKGGPRVSTILEVRGAGKKTAAKSKKSKAAKSGKANKPRSTTTRNGR